MGNDQATAQLGSTVRVTEIHSGAAVEDGQSVLLTLMIAGADRLNLVMAHHLAPRLQRLVSIVAERAERKRKQGGSPTTVVKAERVSSVDLVLPAPDGSVVVVLATEAGHPLQFTMQGSLAADLARQLAAAAPRIRQPKTH
jgi:hypothetical protein